MSEENLRRMRPQKIKHRDVERWIQQVHRDTLQAQTASHAPESTQKACGRRPQPTEQANPGRTTPPVAPRPVAPPRAPELAPTVAHDRFSAPHLVGHKRLRSPSPLALPPQRGIEQRSEPSYRPVASKPRLDNGARAVQQPMATFEPCPVTRLLQAAAFIELSDARRAVDAAAHNAPETY